MRVHDISVIICAYTEDRWDQVLAAVESIRNQSLPSHEIILVVDYNPALYKRLVAALDGVIVIENREDKGLSGARNSGSATATGEIVAYLDDDAMAHTDWLRFLNESYDNPAVIGAGGWTEPNWQTARPAWLPGEFDWVVGSSYTGLPPNGSAIRNLNGANMSFRREVFTLVDGFQSGLGRTSNGRPLGCEETEFCIRVGQRSPDKIIVMENRALVRHFVPEARATFKYFVRRCYAEGISKAQVTGYVGSSDGLSSERSYATRTLPLGVLRGVADALRGKPSGLARSGAIIAGLAVTTAGFASGKLNGAGPKPPSGVQLQTS
jgi:glycosyltransferase involved in cell wall biosynthesis